MINEILEISNLLIRAILKILGEIIIGAGVILTIQLICYQGFGVNLIKKIIKFLEV